MMVLVVMHTINSLSYMYPIIFKLYCTLLFFAYTINSLVHPLSLSLFIRKQP